MVQAPTQSLTAMDFPEASKVQEAPSQATVECLSLLFLHTILLVTVLPMEQQAHHRRCRTLCGGWKIIMPQATRSVDLDLMSNCAMPFV